MKNVTQNVLCSNFFENKYFYMDPKAKVAPTPLLSKTSKNIKNGQELAKLFNFFVRGGASIRRIQFINNSTGAFLINTPPLNNY